MGTAGQSVPIDSLPQPTFIYDTETWRYLAVNQAAIDLYGYSREEFLELKVTDIRPPEDVPQLLVTFDGLDLKPRKLGVWRHLKKDGSTIWMEIYSQDWMENGRQARLIIASEATDRLRLEQALRESEANFRTFFEANPSACVVVRARDGIYTAVNAAFSALTGWSKEETVGRSWRDLSLWSDPEARAPLLAELKLRGKITDVELRFRARGGADFLGLMSAQVIELSSEPHLLSVVRDITAERRAAVERHQLLEQLRQSQKLEAVGRLASGVAHDFNNILSVISSVTDMQLGLTAPGSQIHEDLELIKEASTRASSLTGQLLAFSKKQVLQPRVLDLNQLAGELEKMLRLLAGGHISLELVLGQGVHAVRADPTQLTQVLLNLAVNACDAMPSGGELRIQTGNECTESGQQRRFGELPRGSYVTLSVSDTGAGMDEETQRRAFEPFFTTKGEEGTGLGLATVYGIVNQSGGHIELESTVGIGTTVRIWLPALPGEPTNQP